MPINSLSHMSNFQSTLNANGGPANPARFMFVISGLPTVLRSQPKYLQFPPSLRQLRFLCEATDLPGVTIHTNTRPGYGPVARSEMPGQMDYQPVNLTVLCTDYMREKELFDDWLFSVKNAHSSRSNGGIGGTFDNAYYNNYVVDCAVYLLSNYGATGSNLNVVPPNPNTNFTSSIEGSSTETRYAVRLANVYPTSIDSIQLAWSEEATMRINLTLTYSNWEPIIGASAYAQLIGGISYGSDADQQVTTTAIPVVPT
jgi:hypothetical protein